MFTQPGRLFPPEPRCSLRGAAVDRADCPGRVAERAGAPPRRRLLGPQPDGSAHERAQQVGEGDRRAATRRRLGVQVCLEAHGAGCARCRRDPTRRPCVCGGRHATIRPHRSDGRANVPGAVCDTRSMSALVEDLRHMTAAWDASPSRVLLGALVRLPLYPRIGAVITYRAASWCWDHRLRPLALWLQASSIRSSGAEIHPAARLGRRLRHHPHRRDRRRTRGGRRRTTSSLYHGVTLGHTGTGEGQPRIGDNVRIGAGAKVLGPVAVGDGAWIGANAVVLGRRAGRCSGHRGVARPGRGTPRRCGAPAGQPAGPHQRNVTGRSSVRCPLVGPQLGGDTCRGDERSSTRADPGMRNRATTRSVSPWRTTTGDATNQVGPSAPRASGPVPRSSVMERPRRAGCRPRSPSSRRSRRGDRGTARR